MVYSSEAGGEVASSGSRLKIKFSQSDRSGEFPSRIDGDNTMSNGLTEHRGAITKATSMRMQRRRTRLTRERSSLVLAQEEKRCLLKRERNDRWSFTLKRQTQTDTVTRGVVEAAAVGAED